jgi:hypothetical protein
MVKTNLIGSVKKQIGNGKKKLPSGLVVGGVGTTTTMVNYLLPGGRGVEGGGDHVTYLPLPDVV